MNIFLSRTKLMVWVPGVTILITYLIWELYWYTQVGLVFVKWHTHLMAYAYLSILVYFIYKTVNRPASIIIRNAFLVLGSMIFSLFIAELFLSISGTYETNIEKAEGGYVSPFDILMTKNPYHVWPAHKAHWLHDLEFNYIRHVNSLGFSDPEWRSYKKPKEIRILALGDSFTEGDGAPYDSSYVSLMRQILIKKSESFYIMNAGICGRDPFYSYVNLRDRLLVYKPDIVIQSIGTGDMNTDILIRGGMERFEKGGPLTPPWWEPLYAISYVSRIFFSLAGYNQLLQKPGKLELEKNRINKSVEDLFRDYSCLCQKKNIKLFVVLHPQINELDSNAYEYDFKPVLESMRSDPNINVIDLLPYYRSYISNSHTTAADYYWKHDGHHNPQGYMMMAQTTLMNIAPYLNDTICHSK